MKFRARKKMSRHQECLIFIDEFWLASLLFIVLLISSFRVLADAVPAAENSSYLRIEAGEHTAIINRIALNQDQSSLLTVSDDKTARLWNLPSGELRGILRVPIGDGLEGSIYAGALSPDGKTAILAGAITNHENSFSLYVYDTANLRMKGRLSKLPSEILHLAYASDGTRFAAAFGSAKGIIVWDSSTGKKAAEDLSYGFSCNWVIFAHDGRMATSSDDGFIRIYDPQIKLLKKIQGKAGKQPYGLSFSEDGRLLAVGYIDKPKVEIIDTVQGKILQNPNVDGLTGASLSSVAWSGNDLLAAGGAGKGNQRIIRRWSYSGGAPVDVPVAENTITSLAVLSNGTWLYATAEPSWGIVTAEGRSLVRHNSPITDFRSIFHHHFALSEDGLTVEWRLRSSPKQIARFDLSKESEPLTIDPPQETTFTQAIITDTQVPVKNWENSATPMLGKTPLKLGRNEISRSLSIAADHSGFVLGTDYYLHWFDAKGQEFVKIDVPASAYGVNLSRDGRYLVAALADGTIRWYRLQLGLQANHLEEFAALFLNIDGSRWIAWTKEGFFAHSMDGGKNLAGFHLNRGSNKTPEWIDFGQLYQSFYSPSLLLRKMTGGSEAMLLAQSAKAQEVINGLFVAPVPEVDLVEYCLLDKTDMVTRAFRRVESTSVPASSTAPATISSTNNLNSSCFPISKTTRAFSRVSQPVAEKVAAADPQQEEPILQRDELPAGSKLVRLRFKLKEREGGVSAIQLLRNGVVIENADAKTRGFSRVKIAPTTDNKATTTPQEDPVKEGAVILERDLELDSGTNRLQVRAYDSFNRANGKSSIVELIVPSSVETVASTETTTQGKKPTLHILSVGVNKYREAGTALHFAVNDAEEVAALLEKNFSADDFSKVSVTRLYDEQATRAEIEKAFDKIASQITSREDTIVIYLSGHGENHDNIYYFIPQNSLINDYMQTALSQKQLGEKLALLSDKVNNVLIFLDSCHSGAYNVQNSDSAQQAESLSKARESFGELLMIAAASASEEAVDEYRTPDGKGTGHGVFGYAVLTGLQGDAAGRRDKKVTALQIASFVHNEIMDIRKQNRNYEKQHPVAIPRGNDLTRLAFPLTVIKE